LRWSKLLGNAIINGIKYLGDLKLKKITILCVLLIVFSTLFRCSEQCSQSIESSANIRFIAVSNSRVQSTPVFNLTATGIDRPDSFPDSSIYKNAQKSSKIKVPFDPNADRCSYMFFFDSIPERIIHKDTFLFYHSFRDTIHFIYSRKLKLLTPECGFIMEFRIDSVVFTHNGIDSVSVTQPDINTSNEENIKIYI
jgi:hypothetical protein